MIWLPLSTDGHLIGEASPSARLARQAVEARAGVGTPPQICHRRLPGGGRTEDAEQPPATG